jgi:hypothetical protein
MNIVKKIESDPNVRVAIMDNMANALICYHDGNVTLTLASEGRTRKLGVIKDKMLFVDRDSSKHLHRKSNSYGFNYFILKKSKSFDSIAINEDDSALYIVPKDIVLNMGKVMYFKNSEDGNSFEVQIFLNRDIIKTYKK